MQKKKKKLIENYKIHKNLLFLKNKISFEFFQGEFILDVPSPNYSWMIMYKKRRYHITLIKNIKP